MIIHDSESFKKLIEKLKKRALDAIIIIEGKKDLNALKPLIQADFFVLSSTKESLYEKAEQLAQKWKKAILLLDADEKGKELTKKMTTYLQRNGVKVDSSTGKRLLSLLNIRTVESLKRHKFVRKYHEI